MIAVKLPKLQVQAGQKLLIKDVSWQEFEEILDELGEHRASRIAYHQGDLEIRMPLPEHERSKIINSKLMSGKTANMCDRTLVPPSQIFRLSKLYRNI